MITAMNLTNDAVYEFDDATTPLWAVCYAYCADNDKLSELFYNTQRGSFVGFAKTLPVTLGKQSIACGDWAVQLRAPYPVRPRTQSVPIKGPTTLKDGGHVMFSDLKLPTTTTAAKGSKE